MPSKTIAPGVRTLNGLMEEGEDYLLGVIRIWRAMRQTNPGTERYLDLMAELAVAVTVVKARMESVVSEIDAITDALPEDD